MIKYMEVDVVVEQKTRVVVRYDSQDYDDKKVEDNHRIRDFACSVVERDMVKRDPRYDMERMSPQSRTWREIESPTRSELEVAESMEMPDDWLLRRFKKAVAPWRDPTALLDDVHRADIIETAPNSLTLQRVFWLKEERNNPSPCRRPEELRLHAFINDVGTWRCDEDVALFCDEVRTFLGVDKIGMWTDKEMWDRFCEAFGWDKNHLGITRNNAVNE